MTSPDPHDIAGAYAQLTEAEKAASQMESMLDAIETKMARLEQLAVEGDVSTETVQAARELETLDRELDQLQDDVHRVNMETGL